MSTAPDAIVPDTKDWTWVLKRSCAECGFDAAAQDVSGLPRLVHDTAMTWSEVLARRDVGLRPAPGIWSPLEYGCHVRDVHRVFDERVRRMLTEDDPAFDNWDQDVTAVEQRYDEQDPAVVADELVMAADAVAARYAGVFGHAWDRTGRRSDGRVFTVDTLGRYHLHDVVHHLVDVGS